jgi:two-component system, chemotaxis family, chemotaxis protein CheV
MKLRGQLILRIFLPKIKEALTDKQDIEVGKHQMKSNSSSVLESNRVAGTRLELLLFRLDNKQLFGINVFKVQEIIPYKQLTKLPGSHALVSGIANLRGQTMSIMDLAAAIGKAPLTDFEHAYILVSEYNRSVHGFLVKGVERIVNTK